MASLKANIDVALTRVRLEQVEREDAWTVGSVHVDLASLVGRTSVNV
jgi:hypothetical protein